MDFKRLIFVSGKGGTGKTTIALLMARHLAQMGKSVLFVELANRSSARHLAAISSEPEYKPTPTPFGFDWSILQGVDCLVDYVGSFTVEKLAQTFFNNPLMKTLLNVAPGLSDLSILGKLTSSMRGHGPGFNYDHVVVDAHSTGSFFSLLSAPQILGESVSTGPLRTQSLQIDRHLKDASQVQYFFVNLFEELPMDELEETIAEFRRIYPEQIHIVMNKKLQLQSVQIADDVWQTYMQSRLDEQKKLTEKVLNLGMPTYCQSFFTEDFAKVLTSNQGDFLRDPLKI